MRIVLSVSDGYVCERVSVSVDGSMCGCRESVSACMSE